MAPRKLAAGNWKMNGTLAALAEIDRLLADHPAPGCDVLICPPATLIHSMAARAKTAIAVGGQDCHAKPSGAHTGDISAAQLKDAGASHVILGHSERRTDHAEDDATVAAKAQAAHKAGLTAIVCVGETEAQRDGGETLDVIARQLAGSIPDGARAGNTVVAYEPVWAIGTGKTATPEQAQAVHAVLRTQLKAASDKADSIRILYGGSMNASNAAELLAQPDIDGGLIGGAALKAPDFLTIIAAASR